jgi:transposase
VWLGLTPKQYASGNISRMGGITKRGDRYLRKYWYTLPEL